MVAISKFSIVFLPLTSGTATGNALFMKSVCSLRTGVPRTQPSTCLGFYESVLHTKKNGLTTPRRQVNENKG